MQANQNMAKLKTFKEYLANVKDTADYLEHLIMEEELPRSWEELQDNQTIADEFQLFSEQVRRLMTVYRSA